VTVLATEKQANVEGMARYQWSKTVLPTISFASPCVALRAIVFLLKKIQSVYKIREELGFVDPGEYRRPVLFVFFASGHSPDASEMGMM
jgi:hypothetical protein